MNSNDNNNNNYYKNGGRTIILPCLVTMMLALPSATDAFCFRKPTSVFPSSNKASIASTTQMQQQMQQQQQQLRIISLALSSSAVAASGGPEELPMTTSDTSSNDKIDEKKGAFPAPTKKKVSPAVAVPKKKTIEDLKAEGGPLTFNTPIGALNPFAIYYGLTSIFLGIPWFLALKLCQLMYFVTRNRFDPKVGRKERLVVSSNCWTAAAIVSLTHFAHILCHIAFISTQKTILQRRIPVFLSHVWGVTLMALTRCNPKIHNLEALQQFYKQKRPAMFVANHCSWMDIPFLGVTIGWRNYKLISKAELGKVPILGTAIKAGGNIMVDRANRRSQLATLKQGIQYLKVCLFSMYGGCLCDAFGILIRFVSNDGSSRCIYYCYTSPKSFRTVFICVPSPKEHGLVPVESWRLRMVPSKWHTRLVLPSSLFPLSTRTKSCPQVG